MPHSPLYTICSEQNACWCFLNFLSRQMGVWWSHSINRSTVCVWKEVMGVYSFLKVDLLCHIPGSLHACVRNMKGLYLFPNVLETVKGACIVTMWSIVTMWTVCMCESMQLEINDLFESNRPFWIPCPQTVCFWNDVRYIIGWFRILHCKMVTFCFVVL